MKDNIVFQPKFENFFNRSFNDYQTILSIIVFISCNTLFVIIHANWFIIIFFNIFFLLLSLINTLKFVYYLGKLEINRSNNYILYSMYKFDKLFVQSEIAINKINLKIISHWFQRHTTYELRIYYNNKCVIRQHETNYWTYEIFQNIKKHIESIKHNEKI